MYKDALLPATILIVKTSSLGDIVQTFTVLDDLKTRFPNVAIDWAVEALFYPIVAAHPLVRRAIPLDIKGRKNLWKGLKDLRREKYDLAFDFQGNCKSGVITYLSRAEVKVGYGMKSVREWPNVLGTHLRFNVSKEKNIRYFYLGLVESYFNSLAASEKGGVRFQINEQETARVAEILKPAAQTMKLMVCPGSRWVNKQMRPETLAAFLKKIEENFDVTFFLIWGDEMEKALCHQISSLLKRACIVDKLPIPTWQNLMSQVDLVIAVDSSALHLCGTTSTPSFSIFGPTSSHVFKPLGERHFAIQGACPYGRSFEKICPVLRTCPTGACMKELKVEELFAAFQNQCAFLRL